MSRSAPAAETREERLQRLRRVAALAAARLKSHRGRCATCGGSSGFYEGLCVLGISLRRELEAADRVVEGVERPPPGA